MSESQLGVSEGVNAIGKVETRGVDYIPERERHSNPRDLRHVFFGTQLCFGIIVLGFIPITFGLDWWGSLSSTLFGLLIGSILFALLAPLSTRTGTNSAVSSGAHFGVVGRMVGSLVGVFTAVGFYALTVWTGGQALVGGLHKLFGTPDNQAAYLVGYTVIAIATLAVAILGHANVVAANRLLIPTMGVLLIIGVIVLWPQFNSGSLGTELLLGDYAPTWMLSAIIAASLPISYAPYVGDYTRYISSKEWSASKVMTAGFVGMFAGCAVALAFAMYIGTMLPAGSADWVSGLIEVSPTWYAAVIAIVAVVGSFAQGGLCVYGTGLDTSSIFPRLKRVPATILIGVLGTITVYIGSYYSTIIGYAAAFLVILIIVTAPWLVINVIGYFLTRGRYYALDLQVFNIHPRVRGGAYWYSGGWNAAAMLAWLPATIVGLMFANTTLYSGPWANVANGIDLSFISSSVIAGVIYLILVNVIPGTLVKPAEVSEEDDRLRMTELLGGRELNFAEIDRHAEALSDEVRPGHSTGHEHLD
ncbi:MAG: cytosine permease [Actinomycetes bacterium]